MTVITRYMQTLRNHWKKSTFGAVLVIWGVSYTKHYIETQSLMRIYCEKAAQYGKQPISVQSNPRNVTVILNPNANKRKANADFEKYCAPLLHLSGIVVEIVKTESEGHAKEIMEVLKGTDAVVVAGGDGTLSQVVTGLMRRTHENPKSLLPVGVLPLGKSNTVAKSLFPGEKKLERIKSLADAAMAIIEEVTKPVDVMRIEITHNEENKKPIYALSGIRWGAYRDAEVKKEKYWYLGGLKKYATYLFNGFRSSLSWNCNALLYYSPPCSGCTNCYIAQISQPRSKWFNKFIKDENESKFQRIHNLQCTEKSEKNISTMDLTIFTSNIIPQNIQQTEIPKLHLNIGPKEIDYIDFIKEGWKSELGENRNIKERIEARTIEINPEKDDKQLWFSIDNEDYEVKPIRITLLPKILNMYCKKNSI